MLSSNNFHYWLFLTNSVVSLVFAGAVLLLLKSFITSSGYAKKRKFVSISCSFDFRYMKFIYLHCGEETKLEILAAKNTTELVVENRT